MSQLSVLFSPPVTHRNSQHHHRFQLGFTLIELLIVIAILAALLIMALMAWRGQVNKAHDARRKADLERLKIAFEDYYNDAECYPPTTILDNCYSADLSPYLNSVPCDPVYELPYCYIGDGSDCSQSFKILAPLANLFDPIISKLLCQGDIFCGYEAECAQPAAAYDGFNYGVSSSGTTIFNPDATPPTPTPSPSPSSTPEPGQYACDPAGECNTYADPVGKGCPLTFADNQCNNMCADPANRCAK